LVGFFESGDAKDGHQTGDLVVHDVTMQHPAAGIVGDKGALHDVSGREQEAAGEMALR
jgi:hypothetical protein